MKTKLLALILALLLTGCTQKMYTDGETMVKLNGFGAEHEAKIIFVHMNKDTKMLFVGDYKQLLNPEAIKAISVGVTETILRWFMPNVNPAADQDAAIRKAVE